MKKTSLVLLAALCLCVSTANAQIYKDTIWVPVTFFDFHSDGSNPEFEPPFFNNSVHTGMVANILDVEGKPQFGTNMNQNGFVKYWFRSWNNNSLLHAKGDTTIPVYTQLSGEWYNAQIRYDGTHIVDYDTAFKNIVIHDSLPFRHIGSGIYQYNNQAFFPLDGRGFGKEGKSHNYSFTMELKWKFQKKAGQTLDFTGDDDVWAFVDGKMVMDLGGIHGPENGSFLVGPNIPENSVCTLSVFYAERHTTSSDIKITTNIILPKLTDWYFSILVSPDSTICVGDSVTASARIIRGSEVLTQLPAGCSLTWRLDDPLNPPSTFITTGLKCKFTPIKASTAKITGTLYDSINNISIAGMVTILVNRCFRADWFELYGAAGDPSSMTPLPDTITVINRTPLKIYAKFFDYKQAWIDDSEQIDSLSNYIKWKLSDTLGAQISIVGSRVTFISTQANKYYVITATLESGTNGLSRSVVIKVIPEEMPMVLIVEPNPDGMIVCPNYSQPFPYNKISIQPNETEKRAYAVIRDKFGNFVRLSNQTDWSIDKPIASIVKGDTARGEVIITSIDSGSTVLHATDRKTGVTGWAYLSIGNPPVQTDGTGNKFSPSHFSCKVNSSTLTLVTSKNYIGASVMISDISGRTIDKFTIENTMMNRNIGSKNAGAGSGLYIITVKGKPGRIVVPLKSGGF